MKLRSLTVAAAALMVAGLIIAAPASASQNFSDPGEGFNAQIFVDSETGQILEESVRSPWESMVTVEIETGNVVQQVICDPWQRNNVPAGDTCAGQIVEARLSPSTNDSAVNSAVSAVAGIEATLGLF